MKTYNFNNGEKRFESQIGNGKTFNEACILWGCFDKETGDPLPHTIHITTEEELENESIRLADNREEYEEICERNAKVARGNERLANATSISEFLNAYNN